MWQDVPVVISEPSSGIREELRKSKTVYYIYKENLENKKKEEIFKAKEEIMKAREELDQEVKERRGEVLLQERRIVQKVHKSGTYVLYYPAGCRFLC